MAPPDLSGDVRRQIALDPPRFRGVLHSWAAPLSVLVGLAVVQGAPASFPRFVVGVHALSLVLMFTFSASFHRIPWTDKGWWRMRQLDHTGIYLVIAGSFTSIAGLALDGGVRVGLLVAVWVVTLAGIAYRWSPLVPPFGMMTGLFILLAMLVIPVLAPLARALGGGGMAWLLGGCAVYLVGALALGARVPDPWPSVFGYHEVWHVLVVIGVVMHYVVVIRYALPLVESEERAIDLWYTVRV